MPDARSGGAAGLQELALAKGASAARSLVPPRAALHPESLMQAALGQKVLHGWMQNRHQTLYPLVLNMRNMDAAEKRLLIGAMAMALQAGDPDEAAAVRAQAWLRGVGGSDTDVAALKAAQIDPPAIASLVTSARAAKQGAQTYAAAVAALGRRGTVNRRFHDFLAAKLGIADEVARSLNRRYGG